MKIAWSKFSEMVYKMTTSGSPSGSMSPFRGQPWPAHRSLTGNLAKTWLFELAGGNFKGDAGADSGFGFDFQPSGEVTADQLSPLAHAAHAHASVVAPLAGGLGFEAFAVVGDNKSQLP